MSTLEVQFEQEANAFFRTRLGPLTLVVRQRTTESAIDEFLRKLSSSWCVPAAQEILRRAEQSDRVVVLPLDANSHLLVVMLTYADSVGVCLSVQEGPECLAARVMTNAVESWELAMQLAGCQTALKNFSEHIISCPPLAKRRFDASHQFDDSEPDNSELSLATLQAMSDIIDARDHYTRGHSDRVARLSFELARRVGMSETACQEIYVASVLHDIGKIGIPDAVLLKDGKLTDEERSIVRRHPEIGYQIIERLNQFHYVLPVVLHHHERWDGAGYPHGLIGDATPLAARVVSVADSLDAMTSSRVYRGAMPMERALSIIEDDSGAQWDPSIASCLVEWMNERDPVSSSPDESTSAERAPPTHPHCIVSQDSSVEYMHQALATLSH